MMSSLVDGGKERRAGENTSLSLLVFALTYF